MPIVYLVLGLPGSGRRAVVCQLAADGLPDAHAIVFYQAVGDEPVSKETARMLAGHDGLTIVRYTFSGGEFHEEQSETELHAPEPEAVFFFLNGRGPLIDQLEALPAWLVERGWTLARSLLVAHCDLAAEHPEVSAWHVAAAHFADAILLNRRGPASNKWISVFRGELAAERHPAQLVFVKDDSVENAPEVLFPEARRLTHVFDPPDPNDAYTFDDDEEDEELAAELKEDALQPEIYFERKPGGQRQKPVPDVTKYLPAAAD